MVLRLPFLLERAGKWMKNSNIDLSNPLFTMAFVFGFSILLGTIIFTGVSNHQNGVCRETYGETFYYTERKNAEGNYDSFCKKDDVQKPYPEKKSE